MTDRPISFLTPSGDPSESSTARLVRKKASTACTACRTRRSKCSDGVPCTSCISHRTECIKDENDDGRRRIAMKRKLGQLEENKLILDNMTTVLKHGSPAQIQSLQNLVQANTSREDLCTFLDEIVKGSEEASSGSIDVSSSPVAARRFKTGGIGELVNPPIQVPAQPWTRVTDDNDYVSHLISLWFTWIQPWFRWVEEDVFIEAMQSQDLNNPFCSRSLVNSILAQACLIDTPDSRDDSHANNVRKRFSAEAEAAIDTEQAQGKVSLTMVQAKGVEWTTKYLNGDGLRGRLALNSQIVLIPEMTSWRNSISRSFADPQNLLRKIDKSLNIVHWAMFALNACDLTDYHSFRKVEEPPAVPAVSTHQTAPDTTWLSYPISRGLPPSFHPDCLFHSMTNLANKINQNEELSVMREQGRKNDVWLRNLAQSLEDWPSQLPICMQIHEHATPHVLVLHALHNWTILVLAKQAAAAEAGQATQPIITGTPASSHAVYWQRIAMSRAVTISNLVKMHNRNWSSDYYSPLMLQPLSLALLTLLEDLEADDNTSTFINLSNTLTHVARKYRVADRVLKAIQDAVQSQSIQLPVEIEHVYRAHERHVSRIETAGSASSQRTDNDSPDPNIVADYLLQKWQDIKLDDDSG